MASRFLSLLLVLAAVPAHAQAPAAADVIVTGARIHTADDRRPAASAMAVRDGRIVYVGTRAGALRHRGAATRVLDLPGRTIVPGMIDAHAHLSGLGEFLRNVDLVGTRSYDEVIARVVERARQTPPGTWIRGRGWDQNDWTEKVFPTHDALSRAVPDHPVLLERVDGHAVLANVRAMTLAKVTAATRDPDGGRIERDASGAPTGVFVDNAEGILTRVVPAPTRDETRTALLAAVREANRWGLTGVHDAGSSPTEVELYEELAREGALTLRTYVMLSDDTATFARYFARGPQSALYDGLVWIRAVKLYADGALGSRGAAMLAPYSDDTTNRGLLVTPPERIRAVAAEALRAGFQVATHAIGDRGNREVLDAYAAAFRGVPDARSRRFRIEHAQVVAPADIPRFAALGVLPSMQPVHQTSDMYWAEQRIGARRVRGAYAWRSLLRTGARIPSGSDFPVEAVNPLLSFHSAVSRQDAENGPPGGWYPAQRMTRVEALKGMTAWAAWAGFQEREVGTLTVGKRADFVVLDQDIMTVPASRILATQVLATYLGGRAVYERPSASAER